MFDSSPNTRLLDFVGGSQEARRNAEYMAAYDIASNGLLAFPNNGPLLYEQAISLAHIGALKESRARAIAAIWTQDETSRLLVDAVALVARTFKEQWRRFQDFDSWGRAVRCYAIAYRCAKRSGAPDLASFAAINASTLLLLGGQDERARKWASAAARLAAEDYWGLATKAEALAVLGKQEQALSGYQDAIEKHGPPWRERESTRRQARLIADRFGWGEACFDGAFPEPGVLVFYGYPASDLTIFPASAPALTSRMKAAIDELANNEWLSIFSSAEPGPDVVFLELIIQDARFAKTPIHISMPSPSARFLERLRQRGHDNWAESIEAIVASPNVVVDSVSQFQSADPKYEDIAKHYAARVMLGRAVLHSRWLQTSPTRFTVLQEDRKPLSSLQSLLDGMVLGPCLTWRPISSPTTLLPRSQTSAARGFEPPGPTVKALLFADVVNFSKLEESMIPAFVEHFMRGISELVNDGAFGLAHVNTWGDGLFLVFDESGQAVEFARKLVRFVTQRKWAVGPLQGRALAIRIALHAGPVYRALDPVTRVMSYSGVHVVHAARIEPAAGANEIYASEEFAALTCEDGRVAWDCVGRRTLAKGHGAFRMYRLRDR